ncbi:MAG: transglutaminase family protein [Paracoccus sp. (in: a-proteobacteria)]|jgi:transglutaminase-like putative cysteine protease|uniref:transglutaminase family protein n=1 Tax=unclassified Paracoccus (in: a-proteobacteria) TaxID=2688777 RepID=UPI000C44DCD4|nr:MULTISPECIES: transglutaminase family protein [unclassified Paracoccus (in: a-proteobacteria)]MAN56745.1 transglutaminase [Paracoccus sp. (in: a-proteobacteria)]MBA48228.1 transglutaminase [Paracoccus sp. (in: a-proteobacteria)]MCS5601645.1 transglutaminase family protein [Paracoccus sp. (in: a-proteobacteria)]|tara:strand:+ start:786 stop:1664 length:879 start_codon:yes stop_codon:yes gene_type:complete
MRYRLRLTLRYDFARPTGAGRQLLRICPTTIPAIQSVERCEVEITPAPVERGTFADFFGTEVIQLVLPAGMTSLSFEMTGQVTRHGIDSVLDLSAPLPRLAPELAEIADLGRHSPHHFLRPSPRIAPEPDIAAFAARATAGAPTARAATERLGLALHEVMRFDASATQVDTPIAEAFRHRHGVCQDFSQIMIAGLRALGIPAGYVSGFLRTQPPPGRPRLEGADAMHAWVRAWTGIEAGWTEYDPTNACFVSADHVVIGYGRDYSDTAPITGSLRLSGSQIGSHGVDIAEIG